MAVFILRRSVIRQYVHRRFLEENVVQLLGECFKTLLVFDEGVNSVLTRGGINIKGGIKIVENGKLDNEIV